MISVLHHLESPTSTPDENWYIQVYTVIYPVVRFEGNLYDAMVHLGPKSYIPVYTGIYFYWKVCTSMYVYVQSEESIYLDVPKRVCTYHTRYIRVHACTWQYRIPNIHTLRYIMVHLGVFKYEIFHSSTFGYMRVHRRVTFSVPGCCSNPGRRAGLKAAESQRLKGKQVQTESIHS